MILETETRAVNGKAEATPRSFINENEIITGTLQFLFVSPLRCKISKKQ